MLNGNMHLFEKTNEQRNIIVELLFDDNTGLVVTDYQGIATVALNPEEKIRRMRYRMEQILSI